MIAVPDPQWEERPLACVVVREGADSDVSPRSCATSSPSTSRTGSCPERWTFIDVVPKTSVGKFDKKVLRARHADGELAVEELR